MDKPFCQIDQNGTLRHLVSIQGLEKSHLVKILDRASTYLQDGPRPLLHQTVVVNLFYEPSTRTRSTFELAAKHLGATVLNISSTHSSTTKGETLYDTMANLYAMGCRCLVIRHPVSGAAHFLAQHAPKDLSIINGGDGCHEHPTQALLDMLTIRQRAPGDFPSLSVVMVGDLLHSRVARSHIQALQLLGVKDIRIVAPHTLLPCYLKTEGVRIFQDLPSGLKGADIIVMLRVQKERMEKAHFPGQAAYARLYGLTLPLQQQYAPHALILHPGPINREIEISSELVDSPQSCILNQVKNGVAVRMAVMSLLKEGT